MQHVSRIACIRVKGDRSIMFRKGLWVFSLVAVAGTTALVTFQIAARRHVQSQAAPDDELVQRLDRLERELPRLRAAAAGAQLGALKAAAGSAPTGTAPAAPAPLSKVEAAAKEQRHYDHLDELARQSGGGEQAAAQLRKNLEALRALPPSPMRPELDVTALECGEALCRVELRRSTSHGRDWVTLAAKTLTKGGGTLTMRPFDKDRAVYYVAPPGHPLPRAEL
jgi:hypothetical protein